jgi:tRNA pseudouridine38-40 synthase
LRFRIALEYVGTRYSGWQKQKNSRTIQGEIISALEKAFSRTRGENKFIDLQGSGRTDAGVHAIEQIAHLDCETNLAPHILMLKLNDELPSDINILDITRTTPSFHARHSAVSRQYIYRISRRRTAFEKKYVWWIKDELNSEAMGKCAELFVGKKDFASFSEPDEENKSTIVNVEMIELFEEDDLIIFRIKASHFLWKMVRRLAGVLVETGRGNLSADEVNSYFEKYTNNPSLFTAPPSGLFLEKVSYK